MPRAKKGTTDLASISQQRDRLKAELAKLEEAEKSVREIAWRDQPSISCTSLNASKRKMQDYNLLRSRGPTLRPRPEK